MRGAKSHNTDGWLGVKIVKGMAVQTLTIVKFYQHRWPPVRGAGSHNTDGWLGVKIVKGMAVQTLTTVKF